MTTAEYHSLLRSRGLPVETAPAPRVRADRYRSAWERQYAAHLDLRRAAGEVTWFAYEPMRLRLSGDGTKNMKACLFTPDFLVLTTAREFQVHEVKGFKREAGMVRLKVAASMYPLPFFLAVREGGGWKVERV